MALPTMKVPDTEEEFDTLLTQGDESGKLVIVEYFTTAASDCRDNEPVFPLTARKNPNVHFIRVYAEDKLKTRVEHVDKIKSFPTYVYYKQGIKLGTTIYDKERVMGPDGKKTDTIPELEVVLENIIRANNNGSSTSVTKKKRKQHLS